MPDINTLVHDLAQDLAHDRRPGRDGREVGERQGMPSVRLVWGQASPELLDERLGRGRMFRCWSGLAGRPEEHTTQLGVVGRFPDGTLHAVVVDVVERGRPDPLPQPLQRRPGGGLVADVEQLRLRMPTFATLLARLVSFSLHP